MSASWVTLPNLLTLLRLALAPVVAMAVLSHRPWIALALAAAAGAADGLDGWIARRWRQRSTLGAWLDPIADKILLASAWAALSLEGAAPGWLVAAILGRDLVIVAGALAYEFLVGRLAIAPSLLSKWTTALQIAGALALIASMGHPWPPVLLRVVEALVFAFTVASGAHYVLVWSARARRELGGRR